MIGSLMFYALSVSLLLALAGGLLDYIAGLRHGTRRWIWTAALVATIGLTAAAPWHTTVRMTGVEQTPAGTREAEAGSDAVSVQWTVLSAGMRDSLGATMTAAARFDAIFASVWIGTSSVLAGVFAVGCVALSRRRRQWREAAVNDVAVLVSTDTGPAVVGLASPRIVLPDWVLGLDAESVNTILRHEREHVRAGDTWLMHLAIVSVLLMPWNPVVWWMASRLRLAVELDCDARVLEDAADRTEAVAYGELLLAVAARRSHQHLFASPALTESTSTLTKRITAMFPTLVRFAHVRATASAGAALGLLMLVALVPIPRVAAQTPAPTEDAPPFGAGAYRPEEVPVLRAPVPRETPKPRYTREAMRARIEGNVSVEIVVGVDGTVTDARIVESLDTEYGLDEAALEAAKQWVFRPGSLDGRAVPVIVTLKLSFTIH